MSDIATILGDKKIKDIYEKFDNNFEEDNINIDDNEKVTGYLGCKVEFEDYNKHSLDISELKLDLISIKEKVIHNIKFAYKYLTKEECELNDKFILSSKTLFFSSLEIEADCIKFKMVFRNQYLKFIKILLWIVTLNKKKNAYFKLNDKILYRIYATNIFFRILDNKDGRINYDLSDVKLFLKKSLKNLDLNEEISKNFLENSLYKNINSKNY
jgi:hypothetical protein